MRKTSLWLLRVVCGTKVEWRGLETVPTGACILACKHQSVWVETFSFFRGAAASGLHPQARADVDPVVRLVPARGGLFRSSAGRHSGAEAIRIARTAITRAHQMMIFPEGTRRRPAGARIQAGCRLLYAAASVRSGRAQFRPVLAAPFAAPATGHHRGRSAGAARTRPRRARVLRAIAEPPGTSRRAVGRGRRARACRARQGLDHDPIRLHQITVSIPCLRMIFSEIRFPLFEIMLHGVH